MKLWSRSTEFVFVGIASITLQMIFLRLLIGLFGSSDILYTLIITIWLLETALWSWLAERLVRGRIVSANRSLVAAYIALFILIPIYLLVPEVKNSLFLGYGIVPLSRAALISAAALVIPTAYPGAAFALIYFALKTEGGATISRAYYLDAIGFAVTGLALTLVFSAIGEDLSLLILLASFGLIICGSKWLRGTVAISAAVIGCLIAIYAAYGLGRTASTRYARESQYDANAGDTSNERGKPAHAWTALSPYGRIDFVQDSLLRRVFYNSALVCTDPDPETSESIVLPLAMCRQRKNICVIGNACDGKSIFALHDPSVKVIQVEPDPVLYRLFRDRLDSLDSMSTSGDRIEIVCADPVAFLSRSKQSFDLVLINYSDPKGIAQGNLYTVEFLGLVREHLGEGGVLAFAAKCGENFVEPERLEYIKNLITTLAAVFPNVLVLPGEEALLVGGREGSRLTSDPNEIIHRLAAYRDNLRYFGEAYLPDRLSKFRIEKLNQSLSTVEGHTLSVAQPGQFLLNTILEMDKFNGVDSKILRFLRSLPAGGVVAMVVLPFFLAVGIAARGRWRLSPYLPAFFAGWYGLAFELLLLVSYQSVAGNLYSRLGMLAGMFMAGMAFGAWVGSRTRSSAAKSLRFVILCGLVLSLISALVIPSLLAQFEHKQVVETMVMTLSLLAGAVPGLIFNLSVHACSNCVSTESPGKFYAADLLGSAIGGLTTSILVLPLLGIQFGLGLLSGLSAILLLYVLMKIR